MEERQIIYDDEIDLFELFMKLWKHKMFIFVFTILFTLSAVVLVNFMQPKYKVTTKVIPDICEFTKIYFRDIKQHSDVKLIINNINIGIYTTIIDSLFESRDIAIKVINDVLNNNSNTIDVERILDEELSINVSNNNKSGIIELEVVHKDPDFAYKFANNLILEVENELKRIYKMKKAGPMLIIIESPSLPDKPDSPKKNMIIAVTFVSSIFLAIFLALIIDWIRSAKNQHYNMKDSI